VLAQDMLKHFLTILSDIKNLNRNLVEISPYAENTQKLVNLWMSMFENWLPFG
jgi:hypothetical protein